MYIEHIESLLPYLKDEPAVISQIETDINRICDYFSSLVFSSNREIIMSSKDDPDKEEYENIEKIHQKLAYDAVVELNEIFASHNFEPLFSGDIDNPLELQTFCRDISVEYFRRRRKGK